MEWIKRLLIFLVTFIYVSFLLANFVRASEKSQFITVVNPVRISVYSQNPKESIKSQYSVVQKYQLNTTWLLTYDVINNPDLVQSMKEMEKGQEIGIFLEVTPSFAKDAGVEYNDTGFWHHATSVFLSGYSQKDRLKLIDTVFEEFQKRFGYYPTSVGSWWTDSFSLSYMRKEYSIIANLACSDQFSTDGYQIWGQYWSTPFYPSKYHAGIPASDGEVKLDLVTIQWASRDPLNGYKSSLFSTQDYFVSGEPLDVAYFEKLVRLYAGKGKNDFGQITVGLEGDLTPEAYQGEYDKQLGVVRKLVDAGDYSAITMGEFSKWYRNKFQNLSPTHVIESDDLLNKSTNNVIWYQSPRYRIGLLYNEVAGKITVFDLRTYHTDFQEPYYLSPNKEFDLSIYVPSYFDEIGNSEDTWEIDTGELVNSDKVDNDYQLSFETGIEIKLSPEGITFENVDWKVLKILSESKTLQINKSGKSINIVPGDKWIVGRDGLVIKELTDVASHNLHRKRTKAIFVGVFFLIISLGYVIWRLKTPKVVKIILTLALIFTPYYYFFNWYRENIIDYYISQAEVDALYRLSILKKGKVLVYDKECLGCEWHSDLKPASFANKRNYVKKLGDHPIVYNLSVFTAKDQKEAKEEFDKLNVDYIYLVKYEDYLEKTPFSPGDLGIKKIYSNANAEIWKVVNKRQD